MSHTNASYQPISPDLRHLVALVTGAGSGVGAAVALGLAEQGLKVALVGRTASKLEGVRSTVREAGGEATVFPCDVADPVQVDRLHEAVVAEYGPPQVLVNNAGLHCELVPISQTTPSAWIETFQVNTIGPYLLCRAFMGSMVERGWGRIINVTSASSLGDPTPVGAVYQLSKVTLNHFTRQLAAELAGSGVTANVLHPGEVKTEMWAAIKNEASRRSGPGRRSLNWTHWVEETGGDPPEKTAELILELLAPAGDEINGRFLWIRDGLQKPKPSW